MALAFQTLQRANSESRIPQVAGRPRHHPGEVYAYRAIAMLLLVAGSMAWNPAIGYWSIVLLIAGFIPVLVLNVRHNRAVDAVDPEHSG